MTLRIGNGAGFLGDSLDAPRQLVQSTELDYLTLEYLAELTMSILARRRQKDPQSGYAADFLAVLDSLCPILAQQPALKIVTNAGGVNPHGCARAAARLFCAAGLGDEAIGIVAGDDILPQLPQLQADGCRLENLETGQLLSELNAPIVSAHAYLGARPIAEALADDARLVLTGRVADVALTVGPAVHQFGWQWDDWNRLAGASVAGHLIECGAQVTGGYSTSWSQFQLADIGYPVAELEPDGRSVITKPAGSGGAITRQTVAEQLVYEIGDPASYLTPDVVVDFTAVDLRQVGQDRVAVEGAAGRAPTDAYKVSLAYHAGYMAAGQLLVLGPDAKEKAAAAAELVWQRLRRAGLSLARTHVEYLGAGGSALAEPDEAGGSEPSEIVLRLAVEDPRREAVERFVKELPPLITSGPAGLAGYTTARGAVRPVFAHWPTLVPKDAVRPAVQVRSARAWDSGS